MTSQTEFNTYGADLEKMLFLRTYPIAIRMLGSESEIPEGAIRPKKDRGEHYAICQVFSLARRQGMTFAMFLEDHWCFEPIISYGLVETPQDYLDGFTNSFFIADKEAAAKHAREMTRLPVGQYPGMVVGPLKTANFDPDLTMIYCNPAQLRHLLLALEVPERDPGDLDPRSHRFLRAFCRPFVAVRGMQGHRARSRRFRACRRSGR